MFGNVFSENAWKTAKKTRFLLEDCNCHSACHNCLKHYRNQFAHGMLDRFAALDLLRWGTNGSLAEDLSQEAQKSYISPLTHILENSGCSMRQNAAGIFLSYERREKELVVYPAMWSEPIVPDKIYISDGCLKYAKPYAVQKIINSFWKTGKSF